MYATFENCIANGELTEAQRQLLGTWLHEFMHFTMMSSMVSLCCNGLPATPSPADLDTVELRIPGEAVVHRAIQSGVLKFPAEFRTALVAVEGVYRHAFTALSNFSEFKMKAHLLDRASGDELSVTTLKTSWRTVCAVSIMAFEVFGKFGLFTLQDGPALEAWHRRLRRTLANAVAGDTLLSAGISQEIGDGSSWGQRRRWDRIAMNAKCSVQTRGFERAGLLRNISLGGALVEQISALVKGEPVTVTIDRKRTLDGTVAWAVGEKAGIRFNHPLMTDDPLLQASPTGTA